MATTKKRERGSGFSSPEVGQVHPAGTKIRKNKDGTITLIEPKKKDDKKKKKVTK